MATIVTRSGKGTALSHVDMDNNLNNLNDVTVKAWVTFSGSDTTIDDGFNVSSITDNGTGDYTINFTTSMNDTNYAVVTNSERVFSSFMSHVGLESKTTDDFTVQATYQLGNANYTTDPSLISIVVFGEQ